MIYINNLDPQKHTDPDPHTQIHTHTEIQKHTHTYTYTQTQLICFSIFELNFLKAVNIPLYKKITIIYC